MMKLAAPLVLAELGWMGMGIVDTMMVGRVSATAMGAVSLGSVLFYTVAIFGSGLMLGLDTLVSRAYGGGRLMDCHRALVSALWSNGRIGYRRAPTGKSTSSPNPIRS